MPVNLFYVNLILKPSRIPKSIEEKFCLSTALIKSTDGVRWGMVLKIIATKTEIFFFPDLLSYIYLGYSQYWLTKWGVELTIYNIVWQKT